MSLLFVDLSMNTQNIALLQYVFTHEEHDVKVAPHGNSLKKQGYARTMPSVLTSLKTLSSEKTAKRALSFASSETGRIMSAQCAAALRQQVNDEQLRSLLLRGYCQQSDSLHTSDGRCGFRIM